LVAEIRAAGYGSMGDINQNQQSDYADQMDQIRKSDEYQQQTDLQKQKNTDKVMIDREKNVIEREKLATQQNIADKQLEIARINKNKFDSKSSDKKK
jgi:hypothetical protein